MNSETGHSFRVLFLRVLIGCFFIITGATKLFPIESFEATLVSQEVTNWHFVPYLSRILISLEFMVGFGFLQTSYLKRIFIPATVILLILYSLFLGYQIFTKGIIENCGCFGDLLPMSSLQALIKNILLLGVVVFLLRSIRREPRARPLVPITFTILSVAGVFLIFPLKPYQVEEERVSASPKTVSPFGKFTSFSDGPEVNLNEGKKIVALLSLDCDHCKEVAFGLGELWKGGTLPPTYILFYGEEEKVPEFFQESGIEFLYKVLDAQTFFPLIKDHPPRVCLLEEGTIVGDWDQETFHIEELARILKEEMKR